MTRFDAAQLLVTLLRLDGYDAERLDGNWADLVTEIEGRIPDLIVLDVRLPGANGLELLRQGHTHADPTMARLPILLTSALDHRYEADTTGADGFLLKPYTRETLLEAVKKIESQRLSE